MKLELQLKAKSGIGLMTDSSGCHVAIASAQSGATRLVTPPAATAPADGASPASAPPPPSQVLTQLRPQIGKGRFRLATAVNSREVFCKRLSLPSADPVEIKEMLSLQIEKYSPLPMEEVVWSYEVLGTEGGSSDVLAVFGKKERLIHCATEFGDEFLPDLIDVDLVVLWRQLRAKRTFDRKSYCALLWVDTQSKIAKCMLLKGSTPLLIEHLPADESDPTVLSRAMSVLLLSVEASMGVQKLDEIFLLVADALRPPISNELGIELGAIVTALEPNESKLALTGLAQRALRNGIAEVNLLPMDFVERQQKKLFRQQAKRVGGVVAAGYIVLLLLCMGALAWQKFSIRGIDKELKELNADYTEARQLQAQVEFLKQKLIDPRSALETLRIVSENLADQLALAAFAYKQQQGLELRGTAQNAPDVFTFIDKLQKSGLFSQVKPGPIRSAPQGGAVSFELSCTFGSGAIQPAQPQQPPQPQPASGAAPVGPAPAKGKTP